MFASRSLVLAFAALCAACGAASSAPAPCAPEPAPAAPAAPAEGAPFEMESFQLVLLKRGERADQIPKEQLEGLQKEHLAHLAKLGETGKMLLAGPFSDQPDEALRGMCLYRVGSLDEARALAEQDPAVRAGRLRVEVMTLWVGKGYLAFPKAPAPAP